MNHGGKRKGAGRPIGSGKGRTVLTSSINLPPALWDKLDRLKGGKSRSSFLALKIKNMKEAPLK